MTDLSIEARAVLGSILGWTPTTLQYSMRENIPSPEMQAALDELVAAGLVIREEGRDDQPRGAIRYKVREGVDLLPYRREAFDRLADGTMPVIRVFVRRDSGS